MPDARKSLDVLNNEWEGCLKCPLGKIRSDRDGPMIFGEGRPYGIMFITDSPGADEEKEGRPFVGRPGNVLRKTIVALGLSDCSYITSIVACRSCGPKYDNLGQMMTRKNWKTKQEEPIIVDEAPTKLAVNACMARLYEEIYIVDPVLIVALGIEAARILAKSPLKYATTRGTTKIIKVPGAWSVPDLTQGKRTWERKHGDKIFRPTKQNYVEYLMVTTLKPGYVLDHYADASHGNPTQEFLQDMTLAANIFFRYAREAYGANTPEVQQPDISLED